MSHTPGNRWSAALLLLSLCAAVAPAHAQTLSRGAVEGVVRDAAGSAVIEAFLWLTDTESGLVRSGRTTSGGEFRFDQLAPGTYDLRVEQFGYVPLVVTQIPARPAAVQRVALTLTPAAGEVPTAIEQMRYAGSVVDRRSGTMGQWLGDLREGWPQEARDLLELGKRTSAMSGTRSVFGLPVSLLGVALDGTPLGTAQRPALRSDGFGAALVPLAALGAAELVTAGADVEWSAPAGGFLSGYTRRGGRALEVETFGTWTGDALTAVNEPAGLSFNTLLGGAVLRGPVRADTAHFLVGVETWRLRQPRQQAWRAESVIEQVAAAAAGHGVELGDRLRAGVVDADVTTVFGRFDWLVSDSHELTISANLTALPNAHSAPQLDYPLGLGAGYNGRDLLTSVALLSQFGERLGQEARISVVSSQREYETSQSAGPNGRALPNLSFVAGGIELGSDALVPGNYEQTTLRFTESLYYHRGVHRWKFGAIADLTQYDHLYRYADAAEFIFSDPQQFAAGTGYYRQVGGQAARANFALPRLSFYAQNSFSPAPGLQLLVGARYDYDRFPTDRFTPHLEWLQLTGLVNQALPGGSGRINPRLGFVWDLQQDGSWVLQGSAGSYSGVLDPHLFGEVITHHGRLPIRRGFGDLGGWPAVRDSAAAPVVGNALTLIAPGFQAPRTSQGMLGINRNLGSGSQIFVQGVVRHTEFLPRRADLNLHPDALTTDVHGRAVFGELEQRGGLVAAKGGTSRRFPGYERVDAINADGWSNHVGVTVGFDRQFAGPLRGFASYTFSRTRDNWVAPLQGPEAQLVPTLGTAGGERWDEGVSDFDVPHQAALGAQLEVGGARGLSIGGLYRFRSGYPFTPGFRTGVDINGDGSSRNDPAFVDSTIPGAAELIAAWDCLGAATGDFAPRNACRTEAIHALDLRLGLRLFRSSRRSGTVYLDALNLISNDPIFVDRALFLVDESRSITTDPSGRVNVPLVANPNFGAPLVTNTTGRSLRLGFQLQY